MKKILTFIICCLLGVLLHGCATVNLPQQVTKTYISGFAYLGAHEYLTLNKIDNQFYFNRPRLNESLIGKWVVFGDTLILHPALAFYFNCKDSLEFFRVRKLNTKDVFLNYWPEKLLIKGNNDSILIDISDYSKIAPDSILNPNNVQAEYILDRYFKF